MNTYTIELRAYGLRVGPADQPKIYLKAVVEHSSPEEAVELAVSMIQSTGSFLVSDQSGNSIIIDIDQIPEEEPS
jgi:hypothetical protein